MGKTSAASEQGRKGSPVPPSSSASMEIFSNFIKLVQTLSDKDDFRSFERLVQDYTRLKDKSADDATAMQQLRDAKSSEISALRDEHAAVVRTLVRNHRGEIQAKEHQEDIITRQLTDAKALAQTKQVELDRLKTANNEVNTNAEKAFAEVAQLRNEIAVKQDEGRKLQEDLENLKRENTRQKQDATRQASQIQQITSEKAAVQEDLASVQAERHRQETSLAAIRSFAAPLKDDPALNIVERFDQVWTSYTSAVVNCFTADIRDSILQDGRAFECLQDDLLPKHAVPLLFSNSVPAKIGRSIVVLALLSRLLVSRIFGVSVLAKAEADLRHELCCLAHDEPDKEGHIRAILLSLGNDNDQTDCANEVALRAHKWVKGLVDPAPADHFMEDVRAISREAIILWRDIQSQKPRWEADFLWTEEQAGWWRAITFSPAKLCLEIRDGTPTANAKDPIELKLFPRLIIHDATGESLVVPGQLVQLSQLKTIKPDRAQTPPTPGLRRRPTATSEENKKVPRVKSSAPKNKPPFLA